MQQQQGQSLLNVFQTITFWGITIYYTGRCTLSSRPKEFVYRSLFTVHSSQGTIEVEQFLTARSDSQSQYIVLNSCNIDTSFWALEQSEKFLSKWTFDNVFWEFGNSFLNNWLEYDPSWCYSVNAFALHGAGRTVCLLSVAKKDCNSQNSVSTARSASSCYLWCCSNTWEVRTTSWLSGERRSASSEVAASSDGQVYDLLQT